MGQHHHLTPIRGVRYNLLVAGHPGIENDLAPGHYSALRPHCEPQSGSKTSPEKDSALFEGQTRIGFVEWGVGVGRLTQLAATSRASKTTRPSTSVACTRPMR